jgi:hypothetical protein
MTELPQRKSITLFVAAIFILPSFCVPLITNAAGSIAPNSSVSAGTSLNWAGYTATGGTYTSIGATWIVPQSAAPAASPDSLSADATWVGIGGVSSKDLIQAGTQTVFQNGTASEEAWYELLPAIRRTSHSPFHPGDTVTVSIVQQSPGEWKISFLDGTTGQSYNTSVSYQSSLSSADWIEEMPSATGGYVALDNFGTASFTNGFTVDNGVQLTLSGADAEPLTMINSAIQALAVPSSLGADGASFTVTRTSVAASTASLASPGGRSGYGIGASGGRGRWTRTGVGVQGYTAPVRTSRSATTTRTQSGYGYFRGGFGNFPAFFRTFENNFRNGRDR